MKSATKRAMRCDLYDSVNLWKLELILSNRTTFECACDSMSKLYHCIIHTCRADSCTK